MQQKGVLLIVDAFYFILLYLYFGDSLTVIHLQVKLQLGLRSVLHVVDGIFRVFIHPTYFLSDITLFSGGIQKEILFSLGSGFVGKMDHTVSLCLYLIRHYSYCPSYDLFFSSCEIQMKTL